MTERIRIRATVEFCILDTEDADKAIEAMLRSMDAARIEVKDWRVIAGTIEE